MWVVVNWENVFFGVVSFFNFIFINILVLIFLFFNCVSCDFL